VYKLQISCLSKQGLSACQFITKRSNFYLWDFEGMTFGTEVSLCLLQGKVKQIVGSTLKDLKGDDGSDPITNFESDKSAAEYATLYKQDGLKGGHVIMLGADPLSRAASLEALHAYPGMLV
jgi:hypothetical protein